MTETIKDILVTAGVGTFGTNLFISQMPDSPDNAVCLFDESGVPDGTSNAYAWDDMGLMVMVRGSHSFAKSKIYQIHNAIVGLTKQIGDDGVLTQILVQTPPAQIELDNKGRRIWTAHYIAPLESYIHGNRMPITAQPS